MRRNKKKYFKTGSRQKYVKYFTRDSLNNQTSALTSPKLYLLLPMIILFVWWMMTYKPIVTIPSITLPTITLPTYVLPEIAIPTITIPEFVVPEITIPEISLPQIALPTMPTISIDRPTIELPSIPEVTFPTIPIAAFTDTVIAFFASLYYAITDFLAFLWESIIAAVSQTFTFFSNVILTIIDILTQFLTTIWKAVKEIAVNIFQSVMAFLSIFDPRPLFSWIGGHVTNARNILSYQLYLLSPLFTLIQESVADSTQTLLRNTKDLYNMTVYLSQQNS